MKHERFKALADGLKHKQWHSQHRMYRTSAGDIHTFGVAASTADSASGSFSRQIPPLPVMPAVGRFAIHK
jgi:hypothetical protein